MRAVSVRDKGLRVRARRQAAEKWAPGAAARYPVTYRSEYPDPTCLWPTLLAPWCEPHCRSRWLGLGRHLGVRDQLCHYTLGSWARRTNLRPRPIADRRSTTSTGRLLATGCPHGSSQRLLLDALGMRTWDSAGNSESSWSTSTCSGVYCHCWKVHGWSHGHLLGSDRSRPLRDQKAWPN